MSEESSDIKTVGNLELNHNEKYVTIKLNPKVYSLDVVYTASYVFLEKSFVILDGDPKTEIIVELRPRDKTHNLEDIGREFNNELISCMVYKIQSEKNKAIREAIVQRALLTNQESTKSKNSQEQSHDSEITFGTDDQLEDPLGIAKPWEDKYGNESPNTEKCEDSPSINDSENKVEELLDDSEKTKIPWDDDEKN